ASRVRKAAPVNRVATRGRSRAGVGRGPLFQRPAASSTAANPSGPRSYRSMRCPEGRAAEESIAVFNRTGPRGADRSGPAFAGAVPAATTTPLRPLGERGEPPTTAGRGAALADAGTAVPGGGRTSGANGTPLTALGPAAPNPPGEGGEPDPPGRGRLRPRPAGGRTIRWARPTQALAVRCPLPIARGATGGFPVPRRTDRPGAAAPLMSRRSGAVDTGTGRQPSRPAPPLCAAGPCRPAR